MMNPNLSRFEQAAVKLAKVLLHVGGSAAITAIFAWLNHNASLMVYTPVVNLIEVFVWNLLFPGTPLPAVSNDQPVDVVPEVEPIPEVVPTPEPLPEVTPTPEAEITPTPETPAQEPSAPEAPAQAETAQEAEQATPVAEDAPVPTPEA